MIVLIHVCDAVMGTGKAQPLSEPVLTSCGYMPMGSIKAGMMVYGDDGELHRVVRVFPQGLKYTYRVRFSDGGYTTCCRDHLWTFQEWDSGRWVTETLEEIMKCKLCRLSLLDGWKWSCRVPVCKSIKYSYQPLPVSPENMGVLLNYDPEIDVTGVYDYLNEDVQYDIRKRRIPECYLRAQISDRIALLDSLVYAYRDKSGAFDNEQFVFTTRSRALAESIKDLVDGLGGLAHVPMERKDKKSKEILYDVIIGFGDKYTRRYITEIIESGLNECQCILIDSDSHLYITKDHIVTHNTSAAITYMNQHPDDKFVYITPYLEEAKRIKESCPALNFAEPSGKNPKTDFSKIKDTLQRLESGRNIASTHAAFTFYTDEMLKLIKDKGYTLFIDENVSIIDQSTLKVDDINMALDSGYISETDGHYKRLDKEYNGDWFNSLFRLMESKELVKFEDEDGEGEKIWYYWTLPPALIESFKDVFILTYLFQGQGLYHMFKLNDISYEEIGISKDETGRFNFCKERDKYYVPEYTKNIYEMISVLDNAKLNSIGKDRNALSVTWFEKEKGKGVVQLQKNIRNCFTNIWKESKVDVRLWSTFKSYYNKLKGKGYSSRYLSFNTRATNLYKNSEYLIYAVNIFPNVRDKMFYHYQGIDIDEDQYALSIMLQWIWRSKIRDGGKIKIYIPSKRMRDLLTNWMNSLSDGGEIHEIQEL